MSLPADVAGFLAKKKVGSRLGRFAEQNAALDRAARESAEQEQQIDHDIHMALRGPRDGSVPWRGLDREGMPAARDFAALERTAALQSSPRRGVDKKLREFDERAGELHRRAAVIQAEIVELNARRAATPAADAESLAAWHLKWAARSATADRGR